METGAERNDMGEQVMSSFLDGLANRINAAPSVGLIDDVAIEYLNGDEVKVIVAALRIGAEAAREQHECAGENG